MRVDSVKHMDCCGCAACENICPKQCISMKSDDDGFLYPRIDNDSCINCGACYKVCQVVNPLEETEACHGIYAAKALDETVVLSSSSGGMFTLFAELILNEGGVVYGAALSDDCYRLIHTRVDSMQQLHVLKGSKYLQSQIGEIYKDIKKDLKNGRKVLFSGTPCQVNGLVKYLGGQNDNLFTLDLICHGVPSQALWEKYLKSVEKRSHKVVSVNFRNKRFGWKYFSVKLFKDKSRSVNSIFKINPYMQMMLNNVCLRQSCYKCRAKGTNRLADITLGDFWGVNEMLPEMNDGNGTSAVILNSQKGKMLFERLSSVVKCKEISLDMVLKYNPCLTESVEKPKDRDVFFKDMKEMTFGMLAKKYAPVQGKARLISIICKLGLNKYINRGGN